MFLIIVIILAIFVFQIYFQRGLNGRWKSVGESFAFGRQYDLKRTVECAYDEYQKNWYDTDCYDTYQCRAGEGDCFRHCLTQSNLIKCGCTSRDKLCAIDAVKSCYKKLCDSF